MSLIFSPKVDKHHVPRHSTWYVVMTAPSKPTITNRGEAGTYYEGVDDRGIRLEVITVPRGRHELAFHSMPTSQRHDHQEN